MCKFAQRGKGGKEREREGIGKGGMDSRKKQERRGGGNLIVQQLVKNTHSYSSITSSPSISYKTHIISFQLNKAGKYSEAGG